MDKAAAADKTAPQQAQVGHVSGAFGVKGWVKIHSETAPAEKIFEYQPWQLVDRKGRLIKNHEQVEVEQWQRSGKNLVARLPGSQSRNDAELLKGACIMVPTSRFEPLQAGEYYWYQLEGLDVYATRRDGEELPQPVLLGRVERLMETGANDVMVVVATAESLDSKDRCIPWLVGPYVLEVDLAGQRLEVDWDPEF